MHPTTGILAVFVALNYCDIVHVAGFGYPESRNQKQPIHYYGKETMKSMKVSIKRPFAMDNLRCGWCFDSHVAVYCISHCAALLNVIVVSEFIP